MTATDRRRNLVTAALVAPAALWLFFFLVLPFIAMLVFSFGERAPEGGYQAAFTFEQFANLPSRAAAFWNTLMLAPVGALLCLLVAYPVAYYLAVKASPKLPASPRIAGRRAILDEPARAHLCLDVHPGLTRHA